MSSTLLQHKQINVIEINQITSLMRSHGFNDDFQDRLFENLSGQVTWGDASMTLIDVACFLNTFAEEREEDINEEGALEVHRALMLLPKNTFINLEAEID